MSRNPMLSEKAFNNAAPEGVTVARTTSPAEEWQGAQRMQAGAPSTAATADGMSAGRRMPPTAVATDGKVMTIGGVVSATLVMFAFLLAGGYLGWMQVKVGPAIQTVNGTTYSPSFRSPGLLFGALIGAFALALVSMFKPKLARFTGIGYAVLEGFVLGAISAYYGALYQGIVAQAVLATAGVFLVMLILYGLRILRATPKFVKGVVAATFGIMFMYLAMFVVNLFGVGQGFWTSGSPIGILISLVVVGVAALNLILDFDFIEKGSQMGLPRYMDWYAGVGLIFTLVWLYLEMLRLLARLRQ